jgi:Trehalose utilisation
VSATRLFSLVVLALGLTTSTRAADQPWVVYDGVDGVGKGKHIVFVSGDDEYRSEEALPQMAKILAKHHGFKCTVLFPINPTDGTIDPKYNKNIPGLEALKSADLMVICTRFRDLPDDQMKFIVDYVEAGKPVVGLRTATHGFALSREAVALAIGPVVRLRSATHGFALHSKTYARYNHDSKEKGWEGGFGKLVLGDTWLSHHGDHGRQSTLGVLAKDANDQPILRGIKDGDIWGPTDVYGVRLPLPTQCKVLVLGEVLSGMKPNDKPVEGKKNDPMMPIAWTKMYKVPDGKEGKAFTTTMGASQDLESEGLRRLLVNACYWAVGLEDKIPPKANVDLVGEYKPTGFKDGGHVKGVKPSALK